MEETEEPFEDIEEEEGEKEEFELLTGVDALVVEVSGGERITPADKDETAEVDSEETTKGDEAVADDHLFQLQTECLLEVFKDGVELDEMVQVLAFVIDAPLRLGGFCHGELQG